MLLGEVLADRAPIAPFRPDRSRPAARGRTDSSHDTPPRDARRRCSSDRLPRWATRVREPSSARARRDRTERTSKASMARSWVSLNEKRCWSHGGIESPLLNLWIVGVPNRVGVRSRIVPESWMSPDHCPNHRMVDVPKSASLESLDCGCPESCLRIVSVSDRESCPEPWMSPNHCPNHRMVDVPKSAFPRSA